MTLVKWFIFLMVFANFSQANNEKTQLLRHFSIRQHAEYKKVISSLNQFVRDQGRTRKNTFYISKVRKERFSNQYVKGRIKEYAYAHWVENQALIILSFPLADYESWLKLHCYIDLKKDVVPKGSVENLGCCLVEDDWVKEKINACQRGDRLNLVKRPIFQNR
ncbi:MAG: hypothetical protein AB7K41_16655 [Bdellovibrionales bacterium]